MDWPGAEGDFASWPYADHCDARPGIVTAIVGSVREKFVVFGGITEFSKETLET